MAKPNTYCVELHPAQRRGQIIIKLRKSGDPDWPRHTFEAATLAEMLREVEAFAKRHGKPCRACVTCSARRKPPGFLKATTQLYFNLD